jgi:hypothetical protein
VIDASTYQDVAGLCRYQGSLVVDAVHATGCSVVLRVDVAGLVVIAAMHPLIKAWLIYIEILDRQPTWDDMEKWSAWLAEAETAERWWYIMRKL